MLQNAYLLAKIGADTADNERNFAERSGPDTRPGAGAVGAGISWARGGRELQAREVRGPRALPCLSADVRLVTSWVANKDFG